MSAKKQKLEKHQPPFPLKQLFDEILEEVFVHLKPKDQLGCRQVCHLWNDLLCRDSRLLKKTVGIHLEIDGEVQVNTEHPLTPILRQNAALKVRKISLDAGLFTTNNGETAKTDELMQYFDQFGDKSLVTELKITFTNFQNLAFFKIVFAMLEIFEKVKILRLNVDEMDPSLDSHLINFPAIYNDCRWEDVEEVHFAYFDWDTHVYQNYMYFCEKMPNLKIITGISTYDGTFYQKYSKAIKYAYLTYNQLNALISANTGIQLKGIYIFGSNDYNGVENIWNFLNENQTALNDISLNLDEVWHTEENLLKPFVELNYEKVRVLHVHAPVNDEQAHRLQHDLLMFKNIKKLFVSLSNFGNCFFGHEVVTLSKLETVEYLTYARRNSITCANCISTLMKSVKYTKALSLCMPVTSQDIQLIAAETPHLEDLKLTKLCPDIDNIYQTWPQMPNLQDILIPFKTELQDSRIVSQFCEACPNLKNIRVFESDSFCETILSTFVEKLKNLEKMQFDNGTFVVKMENEERRLVKK